MHTFVDTLVSVFPRSWGTLGLLQPTGETACEEITSPTQEKAIVITSTSRILKSAIRYLFYGCGVR